MSLSKAVEREEIEKEKGKSAARRILQIALTYAWMIGTVSSDQSR